MTEQTHCSGCGVHRDACEAIGGVEAHADGSWVCLRCLREGQHRRKRQALGSLTIIPCPACSRTGMVATCLVCNRLGSVKVPDSEIRVLSTAQMPTVLNEG